MVPKSGTEGVAPHPAIGQTPPRQSSDRQGVRGLSGWFTFFLVLHVLAAISVFGPTFAFPLIGSFAAREPANAALVVRITEAIERKITIPGAVLMPFLGVALIFTGHIRLWGAPWLETAIGLYIVAFFFAVLVQAPTVNRLVHALEGMSAAPREGVAPIAGGAGPPPHVAALSKRVQLGGTFLILLITVVAILMVWHPGCPNC